MRGDYYKIFKKIREDKHLSQTQVAGKWLVGSWLLHLRVIR